MRAFDEKKELLFAVSNRRTFTLLHLLPHLPAVGITEYVKNGGTRGRFASRC